MDRFPLVRDAAQQHPCSYCRAAIGEACRDPRTGIERVNQLPHLQRRYIRSTDTDPDETAEPWLRSYVAEVTAASKREPVR